MAIITLTTDLGNKDYYVGAVKGAILSQLPDTTIIDITHEVQPFDFFQASYIVKNAYPCFPPGTIHIVGVDAQPDAHVPYVAIEANGHYFIGADNGVFSLIFDIAPNKIVELNIKPEGDSFTFPTKDIFVKAACHIARGGTLEVIGTVMDKVLERTLFRPVMENDLVRGTIIYIDSYQNVVCNISKQFFKEAGKGRAFFIEIAGNRITEICTSYSDVVPGELLALFNAAGYLEISINKGNLASLLGIKLGSIISIRFM